ncbi:MAG: hypothetical protein QM668_12675 [Agriterribacter sp.]
MWEARRMIGEYVMTQVNCQAKENCKRWHRHGCI